MPAFARVLELAAKKPPTTILLPVHAFADTWDRKLTAPELIGVRTISESESDAIRAEASRQAYEKATDGDREELVDIYNDTIVALSVAKATCQADDITKPYWAMPDDEVRLALTPNGMRLVFQALERTTVAQSPISPEANDADIDALPALVASQFPHISEGAQTRIRRLLRHVFDELSATKK